MNEICEKKKGSRLEIWIDRNKRKHDEKWRYVCAPNAKKKKMAEIIGNGEKIKKKKTR